MTSSFIATTPSKLTLEIDDYIYECENPNVSLASGFDCVTIEARCWNLTVTKKETEEMELGIVDLTETEPKKKGKKVKARKDRFPKDGGRPIKASIPGYDKIPWSKGTLTLIAQSADGQLHYAKTMTEKKQFAWSNFNWIAVCWPGQYTQDIFLIDDMKAFRKALGFKPRSEAVVTDEEGNEWIDALFEKPMKSTPVATTKPFYSDAYGNKF